MMKETPAGTMMSAALMMPRPAALFIQDEMTEVYLKKSRTVVSMMTGTAAAALLCPGAGPPYFFRTSPARYTKMIRAAKKIREFLSVQKQNARLNAERTALLIFTFLNRRSARR